MRLRWLDYATERKGRFVGLENKDGSKKHGQLPWTHAEPCNAATNCPIAKRGQFRGALRSWAQLYGPFPLFLRRSECGIHVAGAERTFDRDLWDADSAVKALGTPAEVDNFVKGGPAVVTVYAPWCQSRRGSVLAVRTPLGSTAVRHRRKPCVCALRMQRTERSEASQSAGSWSDASPSG